MAREGDGPRMPEKRTCCNTWEDRRHEHDCLTVLDVIRDYNKRVMGSRRWNG